MGEVAQKKMAGQQRLLLQDASSIVAVQEGSIAAVMLTLRQLPPFVGPGQEGRVREFNGSPRRAMLRAAWQRGSPSMRWRRNSRKSGTWRMPPTGSLLHRKFSRDQFGS